MDEPSGRTVGRGQVTAMLYPTRRVRVFFCLVLSSVFWQVTYRLPTNNRQEKSPLSFR